MKNLNLYIISILIIISTSCQSNNNPKQLKSKPLTKVKEKKDKSISDNRILGERINGNSNIRAEINGKIIFNLNDNTLIENNELENNWYNIGVWVKLSKKQIKNFYISPNSDIFNLKDEIIGKAVDTVYLDMSSGNEAFISGYTFKNNIKQNSIIENQISNYLQTGKQLNELLQTFNFVKYDLDKKSKYKEYYISESFIVDPSPIDRVTFLFKNKNVIAIIHSREINQNKFKTFKLVRNQKLTVVSDINQNEINNIIKNRNEFYSQVD